MSCNKKKPSKKSHGITVRGKGNAFILSILAVSVAMVALYNPSNESPILGNSTNLIEEIPTPSFERKGRNLYEATNLDNAYDNALQLYEKMPQIYSPLEDKDEFLR